MQIKIESRHLDGIAVIKSEVFQDDRGFFLESYREDQFNELGLPANGSASMSRQKINCKYGRLPDLPAASVLLPTLPKFNTSARAFTTIRQSREFCGMIPLSESNGP